MHDSVSASETRDGLGISIVRVVALVLLFSAGAVLESMHLNSLHDPEIWRHLRVGGWILENKAWPSVGLFSQAATQPWRDFSWGYDVLSAMANWAFGLRAVPALIVGLRVGLGIVTFLLAGGRRQFWSGVALSIAAQYVMGNMGPGPVFCSALLFAVELILLKEIRGSGDVRPLCVLPVVFLVWANVDIGVEFGIGAYLLYLLGTVIENSTSSMNWKWIPKAEKKISIKLAATVGLTSLAASFTNPYGVHICSAFMSDQFDSTNVNLPGYTAMSFHRPEDYALLLLAMGAFFVLGLQRLRQPFPLCLLILSTMFAFRTERAGWLVVLASLMVIGEAISTKRQTRVAGGTVSCSRQQLLSAAALSALLSGAVLLAFTPGKEGLVKRIAERFPVQACDYIRQHHLPVPLFNSHRWGSFLIWYLPEYPVAIDGRRGLYSAEEETDYYKVMRADLPFQGYPAMRRAHTLLLEKGSVMGEALREVPGFQVAYEDSVAIVLLQQARE